jgi:carboxyl-terminal processing protease
VTVTDAKCRDWSSLDLDTLPPLPASKYSEMFDRVWRRVLDKYYDPTISCLDWPALRLEYGRRLADVTDTAQAVALMTELLGELDESHFGVVVPGAHSSPAEHAGPARPPIEVRWIDDQAVVTRGGAGIPRGSVLVEIDGRPTAALVQSARHLEAPSIRAAFEARAAIRRELSCQPGRTRRLTVIEPRRAGRNAERTVRCELPEGDLVTFGNLRDLPTRVEHRMLDERGVGYLAFNFWMLPMVERVRAALGELRSAGMTSLVLDLRGNPGGVGAMSIPVARMLLEHAGSLGTMRFRGFSQEFNVAVADDPFTGRVALLVDEATASTSEIFAAGMRDLGRVRIFGPGPTAGAALPSVIEELDGGVILQYVVGEYRSPKGAVVEGEGVRPDVLVSETAADFAAGRDPVLDAAVRFLTSG